MTGSVLNAQTKLLFEHLTVKDGLSQSSVTCILQDKRGFMWFGTQDGLNRYDGYEFRIFRSDPANPNSLSDNFIVLLAEDAGGTLWVGTLNQPDKLSRYDVRTQSFVRVQRDSVNLRGAMVSEAKSSYESESGIRWSGDIGGGITRLDLKTGAKKTFRHDPKNPESLLDDNVYSVYGDRQGMIWIGTKEGLDRLDPATERFTHYRHDPSNPNTISDKWVWPIFEDRSGVLWIGTFNGGLNRFDRATGRFSRIRNNPADLRSLSDNRLYSIYQDRSGLIWVGTAGQGVDRFHPEGGSFEHFVRDVSNPKSLVDNSINGMNVDRSGMVWIGTNNGLEQFDRTRGTFTHFRHQPGNTRSLGDNRIQSVTEDQAGNIWIGFFSSGLDKYDKRTGEFTHFKSDKSRAGTLTDNSVYALLEDRSGTLWVGTYRGGLHRYNRETGAFTAYTHVDSILTSLGGRGVFALCEDREGALWVGTLGGGLDRMDRGTGFFTHFRNDPKDANSLSDNIVACIYESRSGDLWIGTTGGLNRFDRATSGFKRYKEKDGLPNDVVLGILEDGKGNLWLSTNNGISRFDPRTEEFRNYDYRDGLQGNEFNQSAYARSSLTGEMYFGGGNGFNVFQPDGMKENRYAPPVAITSFTRYSPDKKGGAFVDRFADTKESITLSYKDNVANFEFAAMNFLNPSKNQLAYRLEGFSDNWIHLGSERKATLFLDVGEYMLRVKGSNNDGVWNEEGATLRIEVTPPWWRSRWAYGLYSLMAIGFLYGARTFELNRREQKARVRESELRAKAVEAEKRALEAENERKTKELEDARKLQLSLLPKEVPQLPAYEIAVYMKTSTEVGGDYYDFSVAPDKTLDIAFGDATGHGMQAGTIVTLMKGLFVSDASRFDIPGFFNHCSKAIKDIRLGRLFMAFTLVRLKGNSVYLSSAGMPPVFIFRKRDRSIEEVLLKGMPLGAMKSFPYALHEASLERGDTLLLLTDGLPEQKNSAGDMFDYERVQKAFGQVVDRSPDEIIAHLVQEGETWMEGAIQDDDITMMVVKIKEQS
jgi:ligand-binding sensor domain-containing protein/serine phosphatase RsbU (regulator of sigma subunit)